MTSNTLLEFNEKKKHQLIVDIAGTQYYTVIAMAQMLQVTNNRIYEILTENNIQKFKPSGRKVFVKVEDFNNFMQEKTTNANKH